MLRWFRRFLFLVVVLLILGGAFLVRAFYIAGSFNTVEAHFNGQCRSVTAPVGPEDFALDRENGLIYISSTDRRAIRAGAASVRGDVYLMRLTAPQEGVTPLTSGIGDAPADFRPHGLSLYTDEFGRQTLMVINHPANGGSTVEIFDIARNPDSGRVALRHRKTVSDPLLVSPNDLAAVDHERFYATNDHGTSKTGWFRPAEDILALPLATVVYWDRQSMEEVADGLQFANGVALSGDGKLLYVTETLGRALNVYARDVSSGKLVQTQSIDIPAGLDNVDVAPDGAVWVAGHPKFFALIEHTETREKWSPGAAYRVSGGQVDEVYLELGDGMSGISTAAVAGNTLILSNIYDREMLFCEMAN